MAPPRVWETALPVEEATQHHQVCGGQLVSQATQLDCEGSLY